MNRYTYSLPAIVEFEVMADSEDEAVKKIKDRAELEIHHKLDYVDWTMEHLCNVVENPQFESGTQYKKIFNKAEDFLS